MGGGHDGVPSHRPLHCRTRPCLEHLPVPRDTSPHSEAGRGCKKGLQGRIQSEFHVAVTQVQGQCTSTPVPPCSLLTATLLQRSGLALGPEFIKIKEIAKLFVSVLSTRVEINTRMFKKKTQIRECLGPAWAQMLILPLCGCVTLASISAFVSRAPNACLRWE